MSAASPIAPSSPPMRILLLNDDYPPAGRSSVGGIAANLAHGYRARGHAVSVITTHRTEECGTIRHGDDLWSIPVAYRPSLRHYRCLFAPRVSLMLQKILEEIQPDVVHAHNIHTYLTYDALRMARKSTPRVFLTLHDVMSFAYARLATARYLSSEGRSVRTTPLDHLRQAGFQWNPVRNVWIRRTLRHSVRGCIAVSACLARALRAHGLPVAQVIHHGIDVSQWKAAPKDAAAFRGRHGLRNRKILLFGGRISIDKGIIPLLRAVDRIRRELPSVALLIVGERERFAGMIAAAGAPTDLLRHIVVTGWLPPEELRSAYAAADVVTTPSLCLDTFNLMNLEAMAAGKPVVGTIFGGTPEIVLDGVTGFVRNPLDLLAYTDALLTILKNEPLARTMGKAGQERAEQCFSLERQVEAYVHLFENPPPSHA